MSNQIRNILCFVVYFYKREIQSSGPRVADLSCMGTTEALLIPLILLAVAVLAGEFLMSMARATRGERAAPMSRPRALASASRSRRPAAATRHGRQCRSRDDAQVWTNDRAKPGPRPES